MGTNVREERQQDSEKSTKKNRGTRKKRTVKLLLSFALATSVMATPLVSAGAASWGHVDYSGYHIVKKGDTMYSIAKKNGMVVERLMDANGKLNPNIYVGQRIGIPAKSWPWHGRIILPEEKITTPYFVGSGDTLYSIAKMAGTSVAKIKKMNGLKSNYIQVGQYLKLSGTNVKK